MVRWATERLTREPGWVLDAALTHSGDAKVFAAFAHHFGGKEQLLSAILNGVRDRLRAMRLEMQDNAESAPLWGSGNGPQTPHANRSSACSSRPTASRCIDPNAYPGRHGVAGERLIAVLTSSR